MNGYRSFCLVSSLLYSSFLIVFFSCHILSSLIFVKFLHCRLQWNQGCVLSVFVWKIILYIYYVNPSTLLFGVPSRCISIEYNFGYNIDHTHCYCQKPRLSSINNKMPPITTTINSIQTLFLLRLKALWIVILALYMIFVDGILVSIDGI